MSRGIHNLCGSSSSKSNKESESSSPLRQGFGNNDDDLVQQVKDMLVCKNFYPNMLVDRLDFRFCGDHNEEEATGKGGGGGIITGLDRGCYVLSNMSQPTAVFVGSDWVTADMKELATHVTRAMERLEFQANNGTQTYDCMVSKDMASGVSIDEWDNDLEVRARNKSDDVEACMGDSTKCPADCPSNSHCQNSIPLLLTNQGGSITVEGTTVNAPNSKHVPCSLCYGIKRNQNSAGAVWYKFTGLGSNVKLSTCGSSFDTQISIFAAGDGGGGDGGGGDCGDLTCLAGNDDYDDCTEKHLSELVVGTNLGQDYYIMVNGYGNSEGNFTLTIASTNDDASTDPTNCGNEDDDLTEESRIVSSDAMYDEDEELSIRRPSRQATSDSQIADPDIYLLYDSAPNNEYYMLCSAFLMPPPPCKAENLGDATHSVSCGDDNFVVPTDELLRAIKRNPGYLVYPPPDRWDDLLDAFDPCLKCDEYCDNGVCVECLRDRHCDWDYECDDGECVDPCSKCDEDEYCYDGDCVDCYKDYHCDDDEKCYGGHCIKITITLIIRPGSPESEDHCPEGHEC